MLKIELHLKMAFLFVIQNFFVTSHTLYIYKSSLFEAVEKKTLFSLFLKLCIYSEWIYRYNYKFVK